jgi:hypothetical protein
MRTTNCFELLDFDSCDANYIGMQRMAVAQITPVVVCAWDQHKNGW